MASTNPARVLVTVLIDALVVIAVFLAAAIIVAFFGALSATDVGQGILRIATYITLPFGIPPVPTGFDGVFLWDAVLTMILAVLAEWALSGARIRI